MKRLIAIQNELKCNAGKQEDEMDVRFVVKTPSGVRSSISPDEDRVEDVNLYVFCRGKLVYYTFTASAEIPVTLDASSEYNVYVIANVGKVHPSMDEQEFCGRYMVLIESLDDIEDCLPFAGKVGNVSQAIETVYGYECTERSNSFNFTFNYVTNCIFFSSC